ncbi:MAG: hypothetical protein J6V03_03970 [Clostridia bacterium]|nr:hypothetical protein [Clostridia bacterium]
MRYFWNFKAFIITLCFAIVVALISMLPQKIERTSDKLQYYNTQIETFPAQKQSSDGESVKKRVRQMEFTELNMANAIIVRGVAI